MVHYLFVVSLLSIYSTNPSVLQKTSVMQLTKANLANYFKFLLPSQCTYILIRYMPIASFMWQLLMYVLHQVLLYYP